MRDFFVARRRFFVVGGLSRGWKVGVGKGCERGEGIGLFSRV